MPLTAITAFCDDIRFEQQGKITLIGLYGTEMFIYADYPTALPKLGVFVQIRVPPSEIKMGDLSVSVYAPGNDVPVITNALQIPALEPIKGELPDLEPIFTVNVPILMSPFMLVQDGYIKIRVSYAQNVYKAGALHVTKVNPPDQNTISSNVS